MESPSLEALRSRLNKYLSGMTDEPCWAGDSLGWPLEALLCFLIVEIEELMWG